MGNEIEARRILLVDDDRGMRAVVRRVLGAAGFELVEAASPEEALALSEQQRSGCALLVTDVVMPGFNGHELASRLRQTLPGLRVLYMSGYSPEVITRYGIDEHADFLQKPFTAQALRERVQRALAHTAGT